MKPIKFDVSGWVKVAQVSPTYHEVTIDGNIIDRSDDLGPALVDAVGAEMTLEDDEYALAGVGIDDIPGDVQAAILENAGTTLLLECAGAQASEISHTDAHAFVTALTDQSELDAGELWELAGILMQGSLRYG